MIGANANAMERPPFDEVVFGEGEQEQRFGFQEFRQLPLRDRVHLLLSKPPRFYLDGVQISRTEAMRFQG
jgi:hypothetical protein